MTTLHYTVDCCCDCVHVTVTASPSYFVLFCFGSFRNVLVLWTLFSVFSGEEDHTIRSDRGESPWSSQSQSQS